MVRALLIGPFFLGTIYMSKFNEKLLEVSNIEVVYNHVILVLKGVSLSLSKGSIVAMLGGNGAGKTTT